MTAAAACMHRVVAARALRNGNGAGRRAPREDWVVQIGAVSRPVRLSESEGALRIELVEEGRSLSLARNDWKPGDSLFRGELDGRPFTAPVRRAADGFELRHRAAKSRVRVLTPHAAELYARLPERAPADTSKLVMSPMPGLVVSIDVVPGQEVKEGETVAVIEAMKMQNIIKAERDGLVKAVGPKAGDSVAADDVLVEFA